MCRLFAFRSLVSNKVHRSLLSASNSLVRQSQQHPDGWGLAYNALGAPHIIRSLTAASECQIFKKMSGLVASESIIAHLRKATVGTIDLVNTHPFQCGPWTFAHNGHLRDLSSHRRALKLKIIPSLRRFIIGDTDSELIFLLILSELDRCRSLLRSDIKITDLAAAVGQAKVTIEHLCGPIHKDDQGPSDQNYLSFVMSNGSLMLAHQGGKNLYFSTYKESCLERAKCKHFKESCEAEARGQAVSHVVFSSEPLGGDHVWQQVCALNIMYTYTYISDSLGKIPT